MTLREEEILNIIKKNPLITQQEIADQLGIERSSVAVHISNLTKKGAIKGKGYIVDSDDYVLVIGASNMDLLGSSTQPLIMADSNPGTISISPGGVGRNIAENLALLGLNTKLLTVVGDDVYGNELLKATENSGVDIHYSKKLPGKSTSVYMSILDNNNDMKVAVSHMDISKEINIDYIRSNSELIKHAAYVIIDTNLEQEVLNYLITEFSDTKFIVDTVSVAKSDKIKYLLSNIFCVKPNKLEAEAIIDRKLENNADIETALKIMHTRGITYPMISLGSEGIVFYDGSTVTKLPSIKTAIANANGAGDAFTAGISFGFFHNYTILNTVKAGQKAALKALQSEDTVNKDLSVADIIND